jgi:hypothetical protein
MPADVAPEDRPREPWLRGCLCRRLRSWSASGANPGSRGLALSPVHGSCKTPEVPRLTGRMGLNLRTP